MVSTKSLAMTALGSTSDKQARIYPHVTLAMPNTLKTYIRIPVPPLIHKIHDIRTQTSAQTYIYYFLRFLRTSYRSRTNH